MLPILEGKLVGIPGKLCNEFNSSLDNQLDNKDKNTVINYEYMG